MDSPACGQRAGLYAAGRAGEATMARDRSRDSRTDKMKTSCSAPGYAFTACGGIKTDGLSLRGMTRFEPSLVHIGRAIVTAVYIHRHFRL